MVLSEARVIAKGEEKKNTHTSIPVLGILLHDGGLFVDDLTRKFRLCPEK